MPAVWTAATTGLIGRERELAELRAGLCGATPAHCQLFLVSGGPGIGKTRLADESGRLAAAQGVPAAWGRCWEGDDSPAYWPDPGHSCLSGRRWRRAARPDSQLGGDAARRAAYGAAASRAARGTHPNPETSRTATHRSGAARFQLIESVVTLRKNVAPIGPLVIVIDDRHDADQSSLLLLKFIAGHRKDLRILQFGIHRDTGVRQSQELSILNGEYAHRLLGGGDSYTDAHRLKTGPCEASVKQSKRALFPGPAEQALRSLQMKQRAVDVVVVPLAV